MHEQDIHFQLNRDPSSYSDLGNNPSYLLYVGVMEDQERLWRETTADDDPVIEREIRRGGQVATDINPKLHYDIQVLISRLVGKAEHTNR